jgi:hypothetical protein
LYESLRFDLKLDHEWQPDDRLEKLTRDMEPGGKFLESLNVSASAQSSGAIPHVLVGAVLTTVNKLR